MSDGRGAAPRRHRTTPRPLFRFWRVFHRHRSAVAALYGLAFVVVAAPTAVVVWRIDPDTLSVDVLAPPSRVHLMGSDYLGRDVVGRVLHGVNTSILVGVSVALTASAIGVVLGLLAGYYGGWVGETIMRLADGLLIIPSFFLILLVAFIFGGRLVNVILFLGVTAWPQIARIVRAEVLSLKEEPFVLSAKAMGASDATILFREILPNTLPPVVAMGALLVSYGILTEASLAFLGVGDPNVVSLGQMLTNGLEYATSAWWVPAFPGAAIFLLVLLSNVLGDGLNVALNPRMRLRGIMV